MEWFSRGLYWDRASKDQIQYVTNYIKTNNENQPIGLFKGIYKVDEKIYTYYITGNTILELIYDTPENIDYLNRLIS